MLQTPVNSGLDGMVVADTLMSEVDGEAGRLIVRGHAIEEPASKASRRCSGRASPRAAATRLRSGRGWPPPGCAPSPKCRN
jgi:citrate synthase